MASGHANRVLERYSSELVTAISAGDVQGLTLKLYGEGLIERKAKDDVSLLVHTPEQNFKASIVVSALERKVKADPSLLQKFITILQDEEDGTLKLLGNKLQVAHVIVFAKRWKRVTVERYVARYKAAVMVVRKFITGFMNRHKPKCPENLYFLDFVRVDYIMKLSKNLPQRLIDLDDAWPRPPAALEETSEQLKEIYRLHLARKYMRSFTQEEKRQFIIKVTAIDRIKEFIKGFINRHKPKCPENLYFLDFVRVDYFMKLSRKLPPHLVDLDTAWPRPPPSLEEASEQLKEIYRLHLARKFVKSLTEEDKAQLTLKLAASDLFNGHKESYPASVPQRYLTTHLSHKELKMKETHFDPKFPDAGEHKFSLRCTKYDRHGHRARKRIFMVTEKSCFLLEAGNFKLKERFAFSDIQQITVSSLNDGFIIFKLPTEGPNARGDLVIETDHTIELVIKLALHAEKLDQVCIQSEGSIVHHLPNGKTGTITFQHGNLARIRENKALGSLDVISVHDVKI